jgi:anti-anti-sigma factor
VFSETMLSKKDGSMDIQIRHTSNVTIIDLTGEIDVSQASRLRQALAKLFEAKEVKKLLINMTDVIYIDSAGLSVLIAAHRQANDQNGTFGLSNLQQPVRQVCHITGIDKVIQIFPTVDEALKKL